MQNGMRADHSWETSARNMSKCIDGHGTWPSTVPDTDSERKDREKRHGIRPPPDVH
jgi:hypothetical protein